MSKLYRSLLVAGLAAAAVAACGDDVTIPPDPIVVTVTPLTASVNVNQTVTFVASVSGPSGTPNTVTWTSAAPAVASVGASTGIATGVTAGTAAITACSTADPLRCGSGSVTVIAAPSASISISSINQGPNGAGLPLGVPVNINNVVGQIDVSLNFEPGGATATRVELLIDGTVVASQGFSSSVVAAGDSLLSNAIIVLSVNTANFNTTTGLANYFNGSRALSARVVLAGGSQVATPSTTLIFNNANVFTGTMVTTGGFASATGAVGAGAGLTYRRGGLSFTVLPVIYTSATLKLAAGSVNFGGCSAGGVRTAALTVPATGASTATLSNTATAGGTNVTAYEFNVVGCAAATIAAGEAFFVNATDNQGNTLFALQAPLAVPPATPVAGIRLDNVGPGGPTFVANPNNRQNGWINAGVGLAALNTSATDNDWLVNGAADLGVGGYNRMLRIDATAPGTVAAANAATASATPTLPARSQNNNDYCAVASATDALANESALPAPGTTVCNAPPGPSFTATGLTHQRFGVDLDAPTIAFSGGLAALGTTAGRITAATIGTQFQVTVADAGAIGVSGMLGGSPVIGNVSRFSATGTSCFFGGTSCANISINAAPPLPLVPTTTVAASTLDGYYTGTFIAVDAAGNQSAAITRSIVYELNTPNPANVTNALFNVPLGGSTATFTALSSDNLDIRDVQYALTYAGGLTNPIQYPRQAINTAPPVPTTLQNSNVAAGVTITGFMRQVEDVTGNAPVTVTGQFKPSNIGGTIRDQVQTSAVVNTGIAAGQVTTGVSYLTAVAAQLIRSWSITNAATNVSDGAATTPANPTSVTLRADAFGPTATFNAPFTRVDFYVDFGGFLQQVGTGTPDATNFPLDDGSAFGRRFRWNFSFTPGTAFALGALNIYAIGVNANGDALVSPVNMNITVTNP